MSRLSDLDGLAVKDPILYKLAFDAVTEWDRLTRGHLVPLPTIGYVAAEEDELPQITFCWNFPHKSIRLYINEGRVLISDPLGRLFGEVYGIADLETAVQIVFTEVLYRVQS